MAEQQQQPSHSPSSASTTRGRSLHPPPATTASTPAGSVSPGPPAHRSTVSTNFGAFLRTLGGPPGGQRGRARSASNFNNGGGGSSSASSSAVSTPAAAGGGSGSSKYESAESKLSSILGGSSSGSSGGGSGIRSAGTGHHANVGPTITINDGQKRQDAGINVNANVNSSWTSIAIVEALSATTDDKHKLALIKRLQHAIKVDASADPAQVWESSSSMLDPDQPQSLRTAGVEVLKACVSVANEQSTQLCYAYERQFYYSAVQRYFENKQDMTIIEMQSLVAVLEQLTRGGRDVLGIDGLIPLLTDIALAMTAIRNRERVRHVDNIATATAPLLDPTFATPFIRVPAGIFLFSSDPKASPAALLIAIHRFSFPHIPLEQVSLLIGTFVRRALQSLGEHELIKTLELIDTVVKFGYIPAEHLEDVVKLVARATGVEGRCLVNVLSPDGQTRSEPLSDELPNMAHTVMRNLLLSPSNQALKYLRAILSSKQLTTPTPTAATVVKSSTVENDAGATCPTPLLVGALRCLRRAFNDHENSSSLFSGDGERMSERERDRYPSLLSMGMIILKQNLLDVLDWKNPDVDSEVLLFIEDRFASHVNTGLTPEEWEMVITVLEEVSYRIPEWEAEHGKAWSIDSSVSTCKRRERCSGAIGLGYWPCLLKSAPLIFFPILHSLPYQLRPREVFWKATSRALHPLRCPPRQSLRPQQLRTSRQSFPYCRAFPW